MIIKMAGLSDLRNKFGSLLGGSADNVEISDDYVELDAEVRGTKSKIQIRTFSLESFEDIKDVLLAIREGYTIALVNIAPLRDKDKIGLRRAIDKLKKTLEANDGDVAGFGDNWLVATPSFAKVYRGESEQEEEPKVEVID